MIRIITFKQKKFLSPIQSCQPIFKKNAVRTSPVQLKLPSV